MALKWTKEAPTVGGFWFVTYLDKTKYGPAECVDLRSCSDLKSFVRCMAGDGVTFVAGPIPEPEEAD